MSSYEKLIYRGHLRFHIYEVCTAIAAIMGGIALLISPGLQSASISKGAGSLAQIWCCLYIIGGTLTVAGLTRSSPRLEVAGLSLFASATAINGSAILLISGAGGWGSGSMFIALCVAALIRAYILVRTFTTITGLISGNGRRDDEC